MTLEMFDIEFRKKWKKTIRLFANYKKVICLCTRNSKWHDSNIRRKLSGRLIYIPFKSLNFEALHGDKEGIFSIRANDQYRIEFTLSESTEEPIVTICNIMELSKHCK